MPQKKDILDLYFIENRHKLIDIAAFLDRVDRHENDDNSSDFRVEAFTQAIEAMLAPDTIPGAKSRAEAVLLALSDHSETPIKSAPMQGALGAQPTNQS